MLLLNTDADVTESLHLTHFNTSYVVIKPGVEWRKNNGS